MFFIILFIPIYLSNQFFCYPSGFGIRSHIVFIGGLLQVGYARHGLFYYVTHAKERNFVLQEGGYHHFIGGIDNARHVACTMQSFVGQGEVAETGGVRLFS